MWAALSCLHYHDRMNPPKPWAQINLSSLTLCRFDILVMVTKVWQIQKLLPGKWGCSCNKPNHMVLGPLELTCGRNVEAFGTLSRKPVECCQQNSAGSPGGSTEQDADRKAAREDCHLKALDRDKDPIRNKAGGHSCCTLAKLCTSPTSWNAVRL